ncbi:MAG: zf-HC2 domain-containing protein [Chloroflexi bacterium]|nr:zf-HC2 domain-containing protein [Chloroflexota bacterium]
MVEGTPWRGEHPNGEILSSYVDGEVAVSLRHELDLHLDGCNACRDQVTAFRGLRLTLRQAALKPVPQSLNRDVWRRIEERERARRTFTFPGLGSLVGVASNAFAIGVTAILIALIAPGASAVWSQLMSPSASDAPADAAQPTLAPTSVRGTPTALPITATVPPIAAAPVAPIAAPTQVQKPAPAQVMNLTPTAHLPSVTALGSVNTPDSTPPVVPTSRAVPVTAVGNASPTVTTQPLTLRTVSGSVAFVDRKQRTMSISSGLPGTEKTWTITLSEGTQFSRADGRKTAFEDVGIADQVEVAGFETAGLPGAIMASALRVTVSAVTVAAPATAPPPRVLFLVDGAENIRNGQFSFTGDWARRLASTGFDVTTADPARISWATSPLKDFTLVVIGYPATLNDNAISTIRSSRLPVLDADPRLVQPFGLGINVDPANPNRQAAPGRTIEISSGTATTTRGLPAGEITVARDTIYRTPIISNGVVYATVTDGGQKRAIWAQSGSTIYLGAWNSSNGANHTDAYWNMFDRSVMTLLGRDASPAAAGGPTATRTATR